MSLHAKLKEVQLTVQQLDPQIRSDRIVARKVARDLKQSAFNGEPHGWRLYQAFRKAARLSGLLSPDAHFPQGGV